MKLTLANREANHTPGKSLTMTEKVARIERFSSNMSKPVPMKLFAAWEVDRTPSNCIPR